MLSITPIALLAPLAVLMSIAGVVTVVVVAAIDWLLNPVAVAAPPETTIVIPAGLIELKSMLERNVVTVLLPEGKPFNEIPIALLAIEAEVNVETSMFRPSAADSFIPPVLTSAIAVTPVFDE